MTAVDPRDEMKAARVMTGFERQHETLIGAINDLEETAERLIRRLEPVLARSQRPEENVPGEGPTAVSVDAPIVDMIGEDTHRVNRQTAKLVELLERLDI